MAPSGPDAANCCLPPKSPVIISVPPVPSPERGDRCPLDGKAGRMNNDKAIITYTSGKSVVVRELDGKTVLPHDPVSKLPTLIYRGHKEPVTAVKMSPSGAYIVSGDLKGSIRVWAFDHEEHLCKYDQITLSGPIRDVDWDSESKRIVVGGERAAGDANSACAKAMQWDTGVSVGELAKHMKGRVSSVAMKPERPFRLVTAGMDDTKTFFHKGPPFAKIPSADGLPKENAHGKGAVHCVRYNSTGTLAASVSTDRSLCVYEGKTWAFLSKKEQIHSATIYGCAWASDNKHIMTAAGDGTCKLFVVKDEKTGELEEIHTWTPAVTQNGNKAFDKIPVGGGQLGCTFVKGSIPVSVGFNGQISILPMPGGSNEKDPVKVITGHNCPASDLTVDHKRNVFYTGDTDGILCKSDLKTCEATKRLEHPEGNSDLMYKVHGGAVSGVAVVPDSGAMLSVGWDDKLYVTNEAGIVQSNPIALGAQPSAIAAGTKVAVISTVQGLLVAIPGSSGTTIGDMVKVQYEPQTVCMTPDDKTVFVGGDDCKIHVYTINSTSLEEKHVIENGHLKPVLALALSNDGKKLASADVKDVCVFDISTSDYKPLIGRGRWCFHTQRVTCLSWSADDDVLASGGADDNIYLWSPNNKMKRIHYPYAHRGGVVGLEFVNKDKKYQFLSIGVDSVVQLWDVSNDVKEKFG